jgi:prepilin-type N-terminal cleavage/methylation domain-containing protein
MLKRLGNKLNQKGMTLIELVITIVIMGVVAGVVIPIFMITIEAYELKIQREDIREQSAFVMAKMPREIRRIRSMKDVLTASSSVLEFVNIDGDTLRYRLVGDELMRQLNGGTEQVFADKVSALSFDYFYFSDGDVQTSIASPMTGSGTATDIQMIEVGIEFTNGNHTLDVMTQVRPFNFIQESDLFNI